VKLGEAYVEIQGRMSGLQKTLRDAKGAVAGFATGVGAHLKTVTIAFGAASAAAAGMGAAIGYSIGKVIKSFASLQQEIAQVSTLIVKHTKKWTGELSTGVQQVMQRIPQAMDALTDSLYDLLSASVPVSKSLEALELSGKAAIAGATDIRVSGDVLTSIMNAMNKSGKDMGEIFDQIFEAIRVGKFRFGELGEHLGMMLPPAQKLNIELPELLGAFADITAKGHPAARAATSLGMAIEGISANADKIKALGIEVYDASGKFRGLRAVMSDIANATRDLTEQEYADVLAEMGFTERGERAITAILSNIDSFKDRVDIVSKAAGSMGEAYKKMKDTITSQWTLLGNAVTVLKQRIGEKFAEAAGTSIKSVTQMVNTISDSIAGAGSLSELWEKHSDLIVASFRAAMTLSLNLVKQAAFGLGDILRTLYLPLWKDYFKSVELEFKKSIKEIAALRKWPIEGPAGYFEELERIREQDEKEWEAYWQKQDDRTKALFEALGKRAEAFSADAIEALRRVGAEIEQIAFGLKMKPILEAVFHPFEALGRMMPELPEPSLPTGKIGEEIDRTKTSTLSFADAIKSLLKPFDIVGEKIQELSIDFQNLRKAQKEALGFLPALPPTPMPKVPTKPEVRLPTFPPGAVAAAQEVLAEARAKTFADELKLIQDVEIGWEKLAGTNREATKKMMQDWGRFGDYLESGFANVFENLGHELTNYKEFWKWNLDDTVGYFQHSLDTMADAVENFANAFRDAIIRAAAEALASEALAGLKAVIKAITDALAQRRAKAREGVSVGGGGGDITIGYTGEWEGFAKGGIIPGGLRLPKMQTGGIIRQPTIAAIAERGHPEAIIPLKGGAVPVRMEGRGRGDVHLHLEKLEVSFPNVRLEDMSEVNMERYFSMKILPALRNAVQRGELNRVLV
jgi:TP901 family phage tail tape measure protein